MSELPVRQVCPFGSICERVVEEENGPGYIERCEWYIGIHGKLPDEENAPLEKRWMCANSWTPLAMFQLTQAILQQTNSSDKVANEVTKLHQTTADTHQTINATNAATQEFINSLLSQITTLGANKDNLTVLPTPSQS